MEEYYDPDYKSLFEDEYANYTIITENDTDEDILRKKEMKPSKLCKEQNGIDLDVRYNIKRDN